jgi:hypothetical protein
MSTKPTNKLEELTDREIQERQLLNLRLIKRNVKTITTLLIVFGLVMIIGIISSLISAGVFD